MFILKVPSLDKRKAYDIAKDASKGTANVFFFEHFIPEKLTLFGLHGFDLMGIIAVLLIVILFIIGKTMKF